MKPSYDPTKPWSRRRREFGASAENALFTEPDFFTGKYKKKYTLPKGCFVKNRKKLGSIIEGLKILTAVKNLEKKLERRILE